MTGGSFDLPRIGDVQYKRYSGFAVGFFTLVVSALVFFTEASFSARPTGEIGVQVAVTVFCFFLMYVSMSDAGVRAGEETKEYRSALSEWEGLCTRVRTGALIGKLPIFCRRLALEERREVAANILASVGLTPESAEAISSDPGKMKSQPRSVRIAIRRAGAVKLLPLTPGDLLSPSGGGRRRLAPVSPSKKRAKQTAVALLPTVVSSFLTVSVAFTVADGLTASAVASALLRLLALLFSGVKGYGMGYRSVVCDAVGSARVKSGMLIRFLTENEEKQEE